MPLQEKVKKITAIDNIPPVESGRFASWYHEILVQEEKQRKKEEARSKRSKSSSSSSRSSRANSVASQNNTARSAALDQQSPQMVPNRTTEPPLVNIPENATLYSSSNSSSSSSNSSSDSEQRAPNRTRQHTDDGNAHSNSAAPRRISSPLPTLPNNEQQTLHSTKHSGG